MKKKVTSPAAADNRAMKHDMSLDEIQELIKMLGKSNVSEISIERKNFKITLRTHIPQGASTGMKPGTASASQTSLQPMNQSATPATNLEEAPARSETSKAAEDSKYITIKSPMIGTFYRSPAPDKPQFVNVGDEIKEGTVLCVIEAMKLFNEIESEYSGKIVKILVENAKPVEYDQPLFLIEPV